MKPAPIFVLLTIASSLAARDLMPRPADAYSKPYEGLKAAETPGLYLKEGDRLAICGDSITGQKMYSRLIETYLTACVPQLQVTCRQFGWSGEKADGFAGRMKNDVLRFQPTIATTCYGMNDHRYVPYTDEIGAAYVRNQQETVMAYAFLKALGLDGEIGTITWDAAAGTATGSAGHEMRGAADGGVKFKSTRYPFCAPEGDVTKDDSIKSAAALIPFHGTLNRFTLILTNATAPHYTVTWGGVTKAWPKSALEKGINLAAVFPDNPFCVAFEKVSKAVFAKQDYETRQIKTLFHGPEGRADMEMTAALTEKTRAPLVDAVAKSVVPVEHVLVVKAVP